ncbi:MAG: lysylphosphatidylglycerol synthase transmembrane domain-containing protein [Solirubrobacterales bacterium]
MSALEEGARPRDLWGQLRGRGFEWLASLASLAFLVLWFTGESLPPLFASAGETAWFALAVAAFGASLCIAAERWHYLLRGSLPAPARSTAYGSLGLGEVLNLLLPMRAGDAVRIALVARREEAALSASAGVLVLERGLSTAAQLLLLVVTASLVASGLPSLLDSTWGALGAVVLLVGAVAGVGWALRGFCRRVVRWRGSRFLGGLAAPFASLTQGCALAGSGLSAAALCLEGAGWWAVSRAVGLDLTPAEALYVLLLSSLVLVIPAGPGAAGTLDAAIVLALGTLGRGNGGEALGFVVLLRLALIVACVAFWGALHGGAALRGKLTAGG